MSVSQRNRWLVLSGLTVATLAVIGLTVAIFWPTLREHAIESALASSTTPRFWWPAGWEHEFQVRRKLRAPVSVEFVETPLSDVLDFFHDLTHLEITIDRAALADEGIEADAPVTIH